MRFKAVQEQPEIPQHEALCEIHRGMYCLGCNRHSCTARTFLEFFFEFFGMSFELVLAGIS